MLNFHTLDVFTMHPYSGNPLAVVLNADALTTGQMQTIAREFNLSETIFVQQPDDPTHTAKVRIFFPTDEIPFAGHPTIGCAILLAGMQHSGDFETEITLEEVAGLVPVSVRRLGSSIRAEFTAPVIPYSKNQTLPNIQALAKSINLSADDIGIPNHAFGVFEGGPSFAYVPIATRAALSRVQPDMEWVAATSALGTVGTYFYTPTADGYAARMFSADGSIVEDPATGSASAIFAAQLQSAGELSNGTQQFILDQGSDMGRPSEITLSVDVDRDEIRAVRIAGTAVHVSTGTISALPK